MKTIKVFMLVIFFSILIFISFSAFATNSSEKQASDFQSNGDLIEGWYWLRDSALQHYGEWTFDNIPLGPEEITVQINALATDRPSGGGGFDAKFLLYYSLRGEGPIPTMLIPPQTVNLENVPSLDDPLGYSCQGQVTIPASTIPAASRISLRIRRDSAQDNHVAFKEDSIVLLTDAIYPPNVDPSSNDDDFEGAVPIQSGTYTGSLGEEDEEGHRDNRDYYKINIEEGQLITLQLTVPGNANYGISLLNPNKSPRGSSITQKEIKTLDYVADSTGTWYIRISRSSGEGEYQLAIDIQDQNDAESGQDASDFGQGAMDISPGIITGLLKAGDDRDYYKINIEEGQLITLQLTVPGNANYGISLLNPNKSPRGSSITQKEIKTLDYVADSTGTWYIRISRSSGEGEYQLAVNSSGVPGNHPPVISSVNPTYNSLEINHYVPITCNVSDQDGDTLTFNWTANGVSVGENDSFLTWRAPATVGTYTITCTVSDGKGGEDSESVSITVTSNGGGASSSCSYSFSSYDSHFSSSGGTGEFTVTSSNSDCQWTAVSDVSWIEIVSGESGTGSKKLSFSIQENNLSSERTGHITINDINYTIVQNPKIELTVSNGGKRLNSNLPIFISPEELGGEIDIDGDGIDQQWEDVAMQRINPFVELDEEEPYLDNTDTDFVANFVRIHPYTPGIGETGYHANHLPKYIIFRYVITWSEDYGRQTVAGINIDVLTSHHGDHERIFMAWKVVDNYTLDLEWIFTSSHKDPDVHHAVWNTAHRTCNKGDVASLTIGWSSISEYDHSEIFCGDLQFSSDGRLIVFASEGKHALYPSCDVCEDVMLVDLPGPANIGEDCGGGGRYLFPYYNIGEPDDWKYKDGDIHDLTVKYDDNYEKFGGNLPEELDRKLKSRYQVMFVTGNDKDAATDAKLDIILFGNNGNKSCTIYTNEEPPRSVVHVGTFEKNDIDNIYIQSENLGTLNQINIVSDNSGSGPGWFVYLIQVQDLETGEYWTCEPNAWIAERQGLNQTFNFE